jgi:hypothetical protein
MDLVQEYRVIYQTLCSSLLHPKKFKLKLANQPNITKICKNSFRKKLRKLEKKVG